jgi:hypothetical protein
VSRPCSLFLLVAALNMVSKSVPSSGVSSESIGHATYLLRFFCLSEPKTMGIGCRHFPVRSSLNPVTLLNSLRGRTNLAPRGSSVKTQTVAEALEADAPSDASRHQYRNRNWQASPVGAASSEGADPSMTVCPRSLGGRFGCALGRGRFFHLSLDGSSQSMEVPGRIGYITYRF